MGVGQPLYSTSLFGEHPDHQLMRPCAEFKRPGDLALPALAPSCLSAISGLSIKNGRVG